MDGVADSPPRLVSPPAALAPRNRFMTARISILMYHQVGDLAPMKAHRENCAEWFAENPGRPVPRLMTGDELRGIRAEGISIGSHCGGHMRLGEADIDTPRRELGDSKSALVEWRRRLAGGSG